MATLNDVITALEDEQVAIDTTQIDDLGLEYNENSIWYIQGLLGCGGWLSAIFFMVFVGWFIVLLFSGLSNLGQGFLWTLMGSTMVFATLMIRQSGGGIFTRQLLLVFQIAGQLLIALGLYFMVNELFRSQDGTFAPYRVVNTIIMLVMSALNLFLIRTYPDSLFRFLATGAIVACTLNIVFDFTIPFGVSIISGILAGLSVWLWSSYLTPEFTIRHYPILNPVRYAVIVALFATIIFELIFNDPIYSLNAVVYAPWMTTVLIAIVCIILWVRLLPEIGFTDNLALVIAIGFTLVIAGITYTSPGVLAGLLLLMLAYRRQNRVMVGLAVVSIAGFVCFYYYNLQTTLLIKSLTMVATGLLFLMARFALQRMNPQEVSA